MFSDITEKLLKLQPLTQNYEYAAEVGLAVRMRRGDLWKNFEKEEPELSSLKLSQAAGFSFLFFLENNIDTTELLKEEALALNNAEEYMTIEIEASLNCLEKETDLEYQDKEIKNVQSSFESFDDPIWLYKISNQNYLDTKCLDETIEASVAKFERNIIEKEIIIPTKRELLKAHSSFYLKGLEETVNLLDEKEMLLLTPETPIIKTSLINAKESAGALLSAAKDINKVNRFQTTLPLILCWTRPGSHHAAASKAGGTCIINNLAVAAANIVQSSSFRAHRVAILDLDAHHGNGTERIFYNNDKVLTLSVHQKNPFFPGTGDEKNKGSYSGIGKNRNYEVKPGDSWIKYTDAALKKLKSFSPEVIFVELSGDAHYLDSVSELNATKKDFFLVGKTLKELNRPVIAEIGASTSPEAFKETIQGFIEGWQSLSARNQRAE